MEILKQMRQEGCPSQEIRRVQRNMKLCHHSEYLRQVDPKSLLDEFNALPSKRTQEKFLYFYQASPVANLHKHMDYSEALEFDPSSFKEVKVSGANRSASVSSDDSEESEANTMIRREVRSWLPINQMLFNDHQKDALNFLVKLLTL